MGAEQEFSQLVEEHQLAEGQLREATEDVIFVAFMAGIAVIAAALTKFFSLVWTSNKRPSYINIDSSKGILELAQEFKVKGKLFSRRIPTTLFFQFKVNPRKISKTDYDRDETGTKQGKTTSSYSEVTQSDIKVVGIWCDNEEVVKILDPKKSALKSAATSGVEGIFMELSDVESFDKFRSGSKPSGLKKVL